MPKPKSFDLLKNLKEKKSLNHGSCGPCIFILKSKVQICNIFMPGHIYLPIYIPIYPY